MSGADTGALMRDWSTQSAMIRKPKLDEACTVISDLCMEVVALKREVAYQKKRQDLKEQQYKTMILEVQNVVSSYL